MLVRKENGIEILTDHYKKGEGKKDIIIGLVATTALIILQLISGYNLMIAEALWIEAIICLPGFILIIIGLVFIKKEKQGSKLIAKVNNEYVTLYDKKKPKQISTNNITKINKVESRLGSFLVIFYYDNEKENKYSLAVSASNKNLIVLAIKEYNSDINVEQFK